MGILVWYLALSVSAQCCWRGLQGGSKVWGLDLRDRRACVSLKMQFRAGEGSVCAGLRYPPIPVWDNLICDHMERDPACAADPARDGQQQCPPPARPWMLVRLFSRGGRLIYFVY